MEELASDCDRILPSTQISRLLLPSHGGNQAIFLEMSPVGVN